MSGNNSKKLQKTKEELQQEIDKVEDLLEDSLGKVKKEVSSVNPRKQIQKNPLPAVSIAVLAGFLLSKKRFKKKRSAADISLNKKEVGSAVWREIKQRILRIAVKKAGDYVEDFFADTVDQENRG